VIVFGSAIASDNPIAKSAISQAHKRNRAYIAYLHPFIDNTIYNIVKQFIKYEVGSEEGVVALLVNYLLDDEVKSNFKDFFDELDDGYLSGESNVGDEELELLIKNLIAKKQPTLIIGEDAITHPQSKNIARLIGLIDKYTEFKVVIIPPRTNSLGVSLICDLDDEMGQNVIGYNEKGDFVLSSLGDAKDNLNMLDMPALNQQEGTFTNIDKKVVPTNAALPYKGYELNDIANALGLKAKNTIDYTYNLPIDKGFKKRSLIIYQTTTQIKLKR
jgi:NADH-quinone oxidoreductase subunit G